MYFIINGVYFGLDFNHICIKFVSNSYSITNLNNITIMAVDDFGYSGGTPPTPPINPPEGGTPKTDINSGEEVKLDENGNPIDDINKNTPPAGGEPTPPATPPANPNNNENFPHEYKEGTTFDVDGKVYKINSTGDVVDEQGAVIKQAAEVSDWIKSFEVSEEDTDKEINIKNIVKALDTEIVDEEGKPVEYENTPEGVAAFVKDAIETGKEEVAEATINQLYAQYPFVKPMIDYFIANGNSLEGFNQVPDRSKITIDDSNEAQQESIIRTAWKEEGRRGNVDNYIAYLKSQGTLAATAKEELAALVEKDKAYNEELEAQAKAEQARRVEESTKYWNGVKSIIESRKIAGYEIPETIIIERDGKKLSVTSNDFFNYLYRTDSNGLTDYAKAVQATKPEDALQDEILRAYLKFTGGSYADLVKMAITEDKVKSLKLQSKSRRTAGTIKINPPKPAEGGTSKETFGY